MEKSFLNHPVKVEFPVFHYSIIPLFHMDGMNEMALKAV